MLQAACSMSPQSWRAQQGQLALLLLLGIKGVVSPYSCFLYLPVELVFHLAGSEAALYLSISHAWLLKRLRTGQMISDCGWMESHSSLGNWSLVRDVFACGWPHMREHMGHTNWAQGVLKTTNNKGSGSWTQVTRLE